VDVRPALNDALLLFKSNAAGATKRAASEVQRPRTESTPARAGSWERRKLRKQNQRAS
jgi:hypothetical protein